MRRRAGSSLIDAIAPRDPRVFELLQRQAAAVAATSETLDRLVHHWPDEDQLLQQLADEAQASEAAGEDVFAHVHATFVGPLERDDATALSSAMSAQAADLNRAGELLDAYRLPRAREPARRATHALRTAGREQARTVGALEDRGGLVEAIANLRDTQVQARVALRAALPGLVADDPPPAELVAWRDVYDQLEHAVAGLGAAAKALRAIELKG